MTRWKDSICPICQNYFGKHSLKILGFIADNDTVLDSNNNVVKRLAGRGLNFASFMSSPCGTHNFLLALHMWSQKTL